MRELFSSLLFTPPLLLLPENEEEEEEEEEREEERREAKVVEVEAKVGGERREQLAHVFISLLSFKFFNLTSTLFSRVERLFFSFLFDLGFQQKKVVGEYSSANASSSSRSRSPPIHLFAFKYTRNVHIHITHK